MASHLKFIRNEAAKPIQRIRDEMKDAVARIKKKRASGQKHIHEVIVRAIREEKILVHGRYFKIRRVFAQGIDSGDYTGVGWVVCGDVEYCMVCMKNSFAGPFSTRHHCRACGNVVCTSCSNNFVPVAQLPDVGPVRVCNQCYWGQETVNAVSNEPGNTPKSLSFYFGRDESYEINLWEYGNVLLRRIEPCFVLKARRQTKTLIYVNICACEHVPLNVNWLRRIQQAASGAADKAARESASAMLSSPIRVDNHIIAMGAAAITAAGVEASSRGWAMQQQQGQQQGQQERSARNVSFSPTCNDSGVEGRASTSSTVRYNQRPSGENGASRGGATTGGHGRGGGAGDLPGRAGDKGTDGAGEEMYAALDQDDGMDYGGPGLAAVAGGSLIYVLCGEKGATVEGSDVFDVAVHPAVIAAAKASDRSGAMAKLELAQQALMCITHAHDEESFPFFNFIEDVLADEKKTIAGLGLLSSYQSYFDGRSAELARVDSEGVGQDRSSATLHPHAHYKRRVLSIGSKRAEESNDGQTEDLADDVSVSTFQKYFDKSSPRNRGSISTEGPSGRRLSQSSQSSGTARQPQPAQVEVKLDEAIPTLAVPAPVAFWHLWQLASKRKVAEERPDDFSAAVHHDYSSSALPTGQHMSMVHRIKNHTSPVMLETDSVTTEIEARYRQQFVNTPIAEGGLGNIKLVRKSITVVPYPGFVIKTHRQRDLGEKVFINVLHHKAIDKLLFTGVAICRVEDQPFVCIGDSEEMQDKQGGRCVIYNVAVRSEYFKDTYRATEHKITEKLYVNKILRQVNLHCSESLNEEEFSLPFVKLRYKGSDPARLSTFSFLAPEFPLGHSDEQDLINRDSESIAGAGAGNVGGENNYDEVEDDASEISDITHDWPSDASYNLTPHSYSRSGIAAQAGGVPGASGGDYSPTSGAGQAYPYPSQGRTPRGARRNSTGMAPIPEDGDDRAATPAAGGSPPQRQRQQVPPPRRGVQLSAYLTNRMRDEDDDTLPSAAMTSPSAVARSDRPPLPPNATSPRAGAGAKGGAFFKLTVSTGKDPQAVVGREMLPADAVTFIKELSIDKSAGVAIKQSSILDPTIILGWQVVIIFSPKCAVITVVTGVRKSLLQQKTEYRVSNFTHDDAWLRLKRSKRKTGLLFWPIRKVLFLERSKHEVGGDKGGSR